MKKLWIVAIVFSIVSLSAQPNKRKAHRVKLTPDQIAEIRTKQMVLHLELSENQQNEIKILLKKQAVKRQDLKLKFKELRKGGEKPTREERYRMKLKQLDAKIAFQDDIKKVLNEKQFETWKKSSAYRIRKGHRKHKGRKPKSGRKG